MCITNHRVESSLLRELRLFVTKSRGELPALTHKRKCH